MPFFNLPNQTKVNRSIPKNAFDTYTNSKQKKLFVDVIDKIKWTNKLSKETINLEGKEVSEIQVFYIPLRKKENIESLLEIIDKSIPYHIIFVLTFDNEVMLSVAQKHLHPTNENNAVIDWTFKSKWLEIEKMEYKLNLRESLDFVLKDFCFQISGENKHVDLSLNELIEKETVIVKLNKEISFLKIQIKKSRQFNEKVELNLKLNKLESRIKRYM